MLNPSLLNVLKENQKIHTEEHPTAFAVEGMSGFINRTEKAKILQEIANNPNATQEERAELELVQVYLPALSRFKEGELPELFEADIKHLLEEKEKKGIL
jgi:hypothetical protein|tara:strand:+ start:727 stop:1026 length:300 start_codon:yes stop_codon:yes gene_type:complete